MNSQTMEFPVYRKYRNGRSFFKVSGPTAFEEIRLVGSKYVWSVHEAKILPDRNFIHDMLYDFQQSWEIIAEEEFEEIKTKTLSP